MENENLENRIQRLESQIKTLEQWKVEKEKQQIKFPLDNQSIEILNKYFMRIVQDIAYYEGDGVDGYELITHYLAKQDNKYVDLRKSKLIQYTVDINTDYLSIISDVNFTSNFILYFATTGVQPTALNTSIPYYVINSTGQRFQISETPGGAAVNFTDKGTGHQFISIYFNQSL